MYTNPLRSDELMHFGIKGMHWGVRRYQNPDGSLTAAGKKRKAKQYTDQLNDLDMTMADAVNTTANETRKIEYYKKDYEKSVTKGKTVVAERLERDYDISVSRINKATKQYNEAKEKIDEILSNEDFNKEYVYGVKHIQRFGNREHAKAMADKANKHSGLLGEEYFYQGTTGNDFEVRPKNKRSQRQRRFKRHKTAKHAPIRVEVY